MESYSNRGDRGDRGDRFARRKAEDGQLYKEVKKKDTRRNVSERAEESYDDEEEEIQQMRQLRKSGIGQKKSPRHHQWLQEEESAGDFQRRQTRERPVLESRNDEQRLKATSQLVKEMKKFDPYKDDYEAEPLPRRQPATSSKKYAKQIEYGSDSDSPEYEVKKKSTDVAAKKYRQQQEREDVSDSEQREYLMKKKLSAASVKKYREQEREEDISDSEMPKYIKKKPAAVSSRKYREEVSEDESDSKSRRYEMKKKYTSASSKKYQEEEADFRYKAAAPPARKYAPKQVEYDSESPEREIKKKPVTASLRKSREQEAEVSDSEFPEYKAKSKSGPAPSAKYRGKGKKDSSDSESPEFEMKKKYAGASRKYREEEAGARSTYDSPDDSVRKKSAPVRKYQEDSDSDLDTRKFQAAVPKIYLQKTIKEKKPSGTESSKSEERIIKENLSLSPVEKSFEFKGSSGTVVPASANYIALKCHPNFGVFEYEVRFKPLVDAIKACNMILYTIFQKKPRLFDGITLCLPEKITNSVAEFKTEHPFTNEPVTVLIKYRREKKSTECLQLYNILFKRIMNVLKYQRSGKQFFDCRKPILIPQYKMEVWPGYAVSVNEFTGGIMLCLDVRHRVLRTQNALDFIYDVIDANPQSYKQILGKVFTGSVVLTKYNNKTYTIHDVAWDLTPEDDFESSTGNKITFLDYYKRQYDIDIKDRKQPLLVHRTTVVDQDKKGQEDRYILLVPEICYLTGLTDEMRNDFRLMKELAQHTKVTPSQRMDSLRKFIANVNSSAEATEILKAWGLKLHSATIDLTMRILKPEEIYFGNEIVVQGTDKAEWSNAAVNNPVLTAIDFKKWLLIHTGQDKRNAEQFILLLQRHGPKMGININKPRIVCAPNDNNNTYVKILQENISDDLQIVCIICPTSRDDRYGVIKKLCCAKLAVPSQVINSRTLRHKNVSSITQKIALQMNCKIGGSLWSLRFPFKKWMICGIDIFHSATSVTEKSVIGFVSSLDDQMGHWYSRCSYHKYDTEIGEYIRTLFLKSLKEYYNYNGYYPTQIVIYRDGVSDSQLSMSQNYEITEINKVLEEISPSSKLIYVIVQKRINSRFFMLNRDGHSNPPPGSIVDDYLTRTNYFDFFLVAQNARQGTVSPTHFIVLHNNSILSPDKIQHLSYKMCHMYYNWCGTIRVPAPCQYAHRLASLVGQYIRDDHSGKLANRLFYL